MLSWIDQEGGLTDLSLQPVPSDQPLVISIFTLSGQEQDPVTQGSAGGGVQDRTMGRDKVATEKLVHGKNLAPVPAKDKRYRFLNWPWGGLNP